MRAKLTLFFISLIFSEFLYSQVGIGTSTPAGSAILHLNSTAKGFLPPVMSTTDRGNISTPANGLIIFNSTENKLNLYNGTWYALPLATSGAAGITLGQYSGLNSQSSTGIAIGQNAASQSQGAYAVALGTEAGYQNQANSSIAIGYASGYTNQNSNSIALGSFAATHNQGHSSIAIGYNAGTLSQSNQNVAIGYGAGYNLQGSQSVAIGYLAGYSSQYNNSIALNASGAQLNPDASGFYVSPIRSNAGTNATLMYDASTKEITYSASDARLKNNIQVLTSGLSEVMRLQPVSFDFRESLNSSEYNGHNVGFVAQQVQEVIPEAVSPNPDSLLAINTTAIIPYLVKAIQELKEENQILSNTIEQIQIKSTRSRKLLFNKKGK